MLDRPSLDPQDTPPVAEARRLVRRFEAATLPRAAWTHEAHVRVGLWYLLDEGFPGADDRMRRNIRRYNRITGRTRHERSAYHETITVYFLWIIDRWRRANAFPRGPCARNVLFRRLEGAPILETGRILRHYSGDQLFAPAARERFVPPDRSRLPRTFARYLESVTRKAVA